MALGIALAFITLFRSMHQSNGGQLARVTARIKRQDGLKRECLFTFSLMTDGHVARRDKGSPVK